MAYNYWDEFWWNEITGPHTVVELVRLALLENKMVVLKVPSDLPWRYSMRSAIQSAFREHTDAKDVIIQFVDEVDDNPNDLAPGKFILQRFAPSEISAGYREKARLPIQEYISGHGVIKNRIVWIKGLTERTAYKWIDFCRGFSPKSAEDGLFVLELHGNMFVQKSKYIEYIDFDEYVSGYDVQLFNSFVLDSSTTYSDQWKKYISTVTATVCGIDAEISELLLEEVDFRKESIISGLHRVDEMKNFDRRGTDAESQHVLWYYRENLYPELQHRVWDAQIQILFPIIELERVELIGKWEDVLQDALNNNDIIQYGEKLSLPIDVELGTLCYMMSKKNLDGFYVLYIPDELDRDRIRFLHGCRNKLAHVSCCTPEEVSQILDK